MGEPEWEKLRAKFPADLITKVQKRGGMYDTVNHAVVTDRLIRHGGDWTYSKPEPVTVVGGDGMPHVVAIVASMTIGGVTRWETGGPERMSNYTQELKESISDFIKRAAMRFGVALDLWSKEDLDGVVEASNEGWDAEPMPSGTSEGVEARQEAGAYGEGATGSEGISAPSDAQRLITGREANALQKALSGQALEIAQARYGIQKLTDLTWAQARELVSAEVPA